MGFAAQKRGYWAMKWGIFEAKTRFFGRKNVANIAKKTCKVLYIKEINPRPIFGHFSEQGRVWNRKMKNTRGKRGRNFNITLIVL